jgi:hypothetical protein
MDDDRTTGGFQRWLELLDESEVHTQIDDIQRELDQLQRRRDLLLQALALKNEWGGLITPEESEGEVFDQSPVADGAAPFSVSEDSGQDQDNESVAVGAEQYSQNGW